MKLDGSIGKHKERLVARGFLQKFGLDYFEVFAPIARRGTIRLMISIAANRNWSLIHMDVKSAFLNSLLQEEVYVSQPPGFVKKNQEDGVQVTKSLVWIEASAQSLELED